ncbi:hypothetical protein HYPSUDRAFT_200826 [Hypholoma sublateritium FD-334 SS-4]|uniref:Uncharacterized protein n=1 Tax=Hypholoma sublateritium (strain FD-334 SS-4) TaxID=945553 RepID=A0A0D2NZ59_HYPSF|nr:hypothetical protein HYPSUDRAFT_200826 [Hypholoma sublateritium FD-334 SS-4]
MACTHSNVDVDIVRRCLQVVVNLPLLSPSPPLPPCCAPAPARYARVNAAIRPRAPEAASEELRPCQGTDVKIYPSRRSPRDGLSPPSTAIATHLAHAGYAASPTAAQTSPQRLA